MIAIYFLKNVKYYVALQITQNMKMRIEDLKITIASFRDKISERYKKTNFQCNASISKTGTFF